MDIKSIVLIILILGIAVAGYVMYQRRAIILVEEGKTETVLQYERRLAEFRRIMEVSLDTSVLSDPYFKSLTLYVATSGPAITPGRPNPFQPF